MAESDFTKIGYSLAIDGKYYNSLDQDSFIKAMSLLTGGVYGD